MKVIEQFVMGKKSSETCEDFIVVSDDFIAVIDGATAKSSKTVDGKMPGRIIGASIAGHIPNIPPSSTAKEAVEYLIAEVDREVIQPHFADDLGTVRAPAASVVVFSRASRQIWRISDCHYVINGRVVMGRMLVDEANALVRSEYITRALLSGEETLASLAEHDSARDFILPLLQRQYIFSNNPDAGEWAYGDFDGTSKSLLFLEVVDVPDGSEVILASDGYPKVLPTLAESENFLAKVLKDDPLLYRDFKATKGLKEGQVSFDDRAYVRFQI
jgi:glycerophosphoryl diester phosphodiesterase